MHNISCNASSWNLLLFMHHLQVICKHVARRPLSLCRTGQPKVVCKSTHSWLHFCLRNKCLLGQSLDSLQIPSLYIFIRYICDQSCWTIGQLILSEVELQTAPSKLEDILGTKRASVTCNNRPSSVPSHRRFSKQMITWDPTKCPVCF